MVTKFFRSIQLYNDYIDDDESKTDSGDDKTETEHQKIYEAYSGPDISGPKKKRKAADTSVVPENGFYNGLFESTNNANDSGVTSYVTDPSKHSSSAHVRFHSQNQGVIILKQHSQGQKQSSKQHENDEAIEFVDSLPESSIAQKDEQNPTKTTTTTSGGIPSDTPLEQDKGRTTRSRDSKDWHSKKRTSS
jgi:hypothetical protein